MIESPVLDEIKQLIRVRAIQETVMAALEARFGPIPPDRIAGLDAITDETRLKSLHKLAVTCPDLDTFAAELSAKS